MHYRRLGKSGLKISEISLGSWVTFGNQVDQKSASNLIHADDLLNMLVFCGCASDVRDTIIHGEVVMRNRMLTRIDEESLLREAEEVEAPLLQQRSNYPYP